MKITVIGSGYVGLVTGACLSDLGNQVHCLDIDQAKIDALNQGQVPIYEPGLQEMIEHNLKAGRISFSTNTKSAIEFGDIIFIAVGTPPGEDGSADLQYVLAVAKNIGLHMNGYKVVIDKSTVPVGTADKVEAVIQSELEKRQSKHPFSVVSNPEFLKEGAALEDFMRPDRIVIGLKDRHEDLLARDMLKRLYAPFNRHHEKTIFMDVRSAELTKYAANAMLATRISFMNEMANLADQVGADIEMVRQGIGSDSRIGYSFLYPGTGYGGSCFPKDVQALIRTGQQHHQAMRVLSAVEEVNEGQKIVLLDKVKKHFSNNLKDRKIAIWGLAFKPNTDDMREAPSRKLIKCLLEAGAQLSVYDPIAMKEARHCLAQDVSENPALLGHLNFSESMMGALDGVDALMIVTEWKEFKSPDFEVIKQVMKSRTIFDGRNLYDPGSLRLDGFTYYTVGRDAC